MAKLYLLAQAVDVPDSIITFLMAHDGNHIVEVSLKCVCGANMTEKIALPINAEKGGRPWR